MAWLLKTALQSLRVDQNDNHLGRPRFQRFGDLYHEISSFVDFT